MGVYSVSGLLHIYVYHSFSTSRGTYRFLEIEARKRDRTLSKDTRQAARSLAEIILNR